MKPPAGGAVAVAVFSPRTDLRTTRIAPGERWATLMWGVLGQDSAATSP
ncbi:MAG: hypothetical protein ABWX96_16635 [Propionibacteriaceae bacterium]